MKRIPRETALLGVSDALRLFPFAFAVGVCSPFGTAGACMTAAVALLFGVVCRLAFVPTYLALLPVFTVAYRFGAAGACAAVLLGGICIFLLSLLPRSVRDALHAPAVRAVFLIAAAFSTTALQTTLYFGIGAVGGTVPQILRDYVSLGFHPNWRGILYGTIVMVVLITYPRKFKKLSRILPAAFAALVVTLPLHLLLVRDAAHSPVAEIGAFSVLQLPDGAFLRGDFSASALPLILCSALSFALIVSAGLPDGAARSLSAASVCGGFLGAAPMQTDGMPRARKSAWIAVPLTALLFFVPGLKRTPVPCLAVILIVTAWQSVDWSAAKRAFTARRFPFFICAAVLPVLLGIHYAVPLLCLLGAAENRLDQKTSV